MAGEGDAERLVVLLEARIRDFERNMAKAQGTANKSYAGMRQGSRSATRQMEADMGRSTRFINNALASTSSRIGSFSAAAVTGFLAPVAAILSFQAAITGAREALSEFDRIGKAAKSAGLDAEVFQGLEHAAMLGGVAVGELSQALNTFNRNAGLAATGKGELVEKLKQLHPELLRSILLSSDQEERIRLVADALDRETDASRKAAIASAVFGDAGLKMVEALKGGASQIDATMAKARALGIVVDRELIARAETLNDEFSTVSRVIDVQLKTALVNLAPTITWITEQIAGWTRSLNIVLDQFKGVEERTFVRPLQNELAGVLNQRMTLQDQIRQMEEGMNIPFISDAALARARGELETLTSRALTLQERIAQLQGKPKEGATPPATLPPPTTGGGLPPSLFGGDGSTPQSVQQFIDALQAERDAIALSIVEQEKLAAVRQAGSAATAQQQEQIRGLVQSIYDEQAAAEIRASMEGPFEVINRQLEELEGQLARGALSWEEYGHAAMRARAMAAGEAVQMVGQITGAMSQLFEDNKALQLANVGVNTGAAVMKTLADYGGTPWGWAAVAGVVASGAAQAASIMSARPGSANIASGGAGGSSAPATPAAMPQQRAVNITLHGENFSQRQVEDLIRQISDNVETNGATPLVNSLGRALR